MLYHTCNRSCACLNSSYRWTRIYWCNLWLTVNSSHVTSSLFHQKVNTSQWTRHKDCHKVKWTRHTVISSHWRRGDLVTQNFLLSSQGLSQHLPHRFSHPPHSLRRVCSLVTRALETDDFTSIPHEREALRHLLSVLKRRQVFWNILL